MLFFGRDTAYAASLFLPRLSSPDGDNTGNQKIHVVAALAL